jgi:DNA-binding response OmpR family regulator
MKERSGTLTLADRLSRLIHRKPSAGRADLAHPDGPPETGPRETGPPDAGQPSILLSDAREALSLGALALATNPPPPRTLTYDGLPPAAAGAYRPDSAPLKTAAVATPRVLIAEADPLHRAVLARLVENSGCAVDCVNSGAEATAAFQSQAYVLVMLDVDSDQMRGLDTAAAVRQMERTGRRTPIVGITANAADNERDRRERHTAGIDDCLAKPILRENVKSVVSRYASVTTAEPLTLGWQRLVELDEAAGDRVELLSGWIDLFLSGASEELDQMRAAQEKGDAAGLCRTAGKLRGRSGQLGALRVQEICGIIAALSTSGSLAGVESLLPEVALAMERAARDLRALQNDLSEGRRPAILRSRDVGARFAGGAARSNHVLLAEDDTLIARFLVNSLTSAGFPVTHHVGGRAALDALRDQEFGAAILDLDVREVDGYSMLAEIRASLHGTIPVMIVSSRHQEQNMLRAFELGADDFVTIPFNPLEVAVRLRRMVRQGAHVA